MIIVDFSQIAISNLMMSFNRPDMKDDKGKPIVDGTIIRDMILKSLLAYHTKHQQVYGEMVLAIDGGSSWRKTIFPYYKFRRGLNRDVSVIDWDKVYEILNALERELDELFAYRVVRVQSAEGDDIIGTLCHKFGNEGPLVFGQKILIISGDKDFRQLQIYSNVAQYDPIQKKMMREKDAVGYLIEHIMRGDNGDDIPNFLSDDNSFVIKKRQKAIRETKMAVWRKSSEEFDDNMKRNFERNSQLIDLKRVPSELQEKILDKYHQQAGKTTGDLRKYFIAHRLRTLMESIGDF